MLGRDCSLLNNSVDTGIVGSFGAVDLVGDTHFVELVFGSTVFTVCLFTYYRLFYSKTTAFF